MFVSSIEEKCLISATFADLILKSVPLGKNIPPDGRLPIAIL